MKRQPPRPQYTIGVDIAQEQCVWVVLEGPTQTLVASGEVQRTPQALARWAARMRQQWPQALVLLEATGGLERSVRQAMHQAGMAVWVRRQQGPLWAFYDRLRRRGKPTFVALVALMRRLLVILNAILRDRTPWMPEKAMAKT